MLARINTLLAALVLALSLVVVVQWVSPYGSQQQQREPQRREDTNHGQGVTQHAAPTHFGVQIECDPNCTAEKPNQNANEGAVARLFRKTVDDPLILFTFLLAVGTIILAIYTAVVARATKTAAEHIPRVERAHLFITIRTHNIRDLFQVGRLYDNSPTMHPNPMEWPVVEYVLKNYGKTPAILKEIGHGMAMQQQAGAARSYTFVERALEVIAPGEESEPITFGLGPPFTFADSRSVLNRCDQCPK